MPHVSNVSHLQLRFGEKKKLGRSSGITININFIPKEIHTVVIGVSRTVYGERICSQSNHLLPLHWQKAEQAGLNRGRRCLSGYGDYLELMSEHLKE